MPRPLSDDPKSEHVTLRLTKSERERLDRDRGNLTVTEWIRRCIFKGR